MKYATIGCALLLFAGLSSAAPILEHRSLADRLVSNFDTRGSYGFDVRSHWGDDFKLERHETSFREALDRETSKHHWFKEHDWKNCGDGWNKGGGGDSGGGEPGSVPEPATMGLLGTALLGLGWLRSRRAGVR
jgi:hypothetical protein